eukprot:1308589-Prorocentrum_lima.AAC.1
MSFGRNRPGTTLDPCCPSGWTSDDTAVKFSNRARTSSPELALIGQRHSRKGPHTTPNIPLRSARVPKP